MFIWSDFVATYINTPSYPAKWKSNGLIAYPRPLATFSNPSNLAILLALSSMLVMSAAKLYTPRYQTASPPHQVVYLGEPQRL